MRTIETKVYQFSELSEEAKEEAIYHFRVDPFHLEYIHNEAFDSMEKFADIFNIRISSIDFEEPYRNEYQIKLDDTVLALSGQRLATYIWNNYKHDLFKDKYYGRLSDFDNYGIKIPKSKDHPIGKRHVKHYSKCQLDNSCVLTGVCYDDDLLTPIYDFLKKPLETLDFETLLNDCIYALCHSIQQEIEYQLSDESITETIEANEYEFTEDGTLI